MPRRVREELGRRRERKGGREDGRRSKQEVKSLEIGLYLQAKILGQRKGAFALRTTKPNQRKLKNMEHASC